VNLNFMKIFIILLVKSKYIFIFVYRMLTSQIKSKFTMWKNFFYFSKGQRIGIIVLISFIIIVLIANFALPLFFPREEMPKNRFLSEVKAFKKTLVSRDSIRQAMWQQKYEDRYKKYQHYQNYALTKHDLTYTLFTFDPNTIDSAGFTRLGLKPYMASNILKYRLKGGRFRTTADFSKVYSITPDKFKELEPYITIKDMPKPKVDTIVAPKKAFKQDIIVDLNSADTTLLMQVKGIGRGYAKGIVRFRKETGGFVSVDQLHEIYGMRPENFDRIRPFCTVNTALIQRIKVNIASVERLNAHPYINFYQAKALFELRRKKGRLKEINDLKVLQEFSSEDLNRLKPYLSFE
jgi:DNA uptake protein ComE-like DNA-binding protein